MNGSIYREGIQQGSIVTIQKLRGEDVRKNVIQNFFKKLETEEA